MSIWIGSRSEAVGCAGEVELCDRVLDNRRRVDRYYVQGAWGNNSGKRQEPKVLLKLSLHPAVRSSV